MRNQVIQGFEIKYNAPVLLLAVLPHRASIAPSRPGRSHNVVHDEGAIVANGEEKLFVAR